MTDHVVEHCPFCGGTILVAARIGQTLTAVKKAQTVTRLIGLCLITTHAACGAVLAESELEVKS